MVKSAANASDARGYAIALVFSTALSACMVGPDYRRPDVEVPATWRLQDAEARDLSNIAWWDQFQDPVLSDLVRIALANNKDLKIATANIDRAVAQYGIARSAQFPQINAGGSAMRERGSPNAPVPARHVVGEYSLSLSATFELDLWGKLRRATEAARAGVLASREGRGTVLLTVVAAVASGYIELRALDRQVEIARRTSDNLGRAARLQRLRYEEGAIPESDYQQAESQYREAVARVPELERQIARQENFISVVLGRNPGPITRGRDIDAFSFPTVPNGLPAVLLERRPDIRQAEQQLIAANANIGVAKAAYLPDISLTGMLGLESAQLSNLLVGPSRIWSFGASVLQPIFNAGRIHGEVEQAEAVQQEALYAYERSIINAFQDVENALVDRAQLAKVSSEQLRNLDALRRFRDLADLRYREGVTIYLEVANAEQSLLNAQLAYVATQSQLFQSYANLYKAMGGGWVDDAEEPIGGSDSADYR